MNNENKDIVVTTKDIDEINFEESLEEIFALSY